MAPRFRGPVGLHPASRGHAAIACRRREADTQRRGPFDCASPGPARGLRLAPVDEAARYPDFLQFRTALRQIIARRDVPALLAVIHPNIKNSFGGDDGVEQFKRIWRPEQLDSHVWNELDALLSLGGTFSGPDTFVAPYVYANWPQEFDAFDYWAVIGRNVRVRRPETPVVASCGR